MGAAVQVCVIVLLFGRCAAVTLLCNCSFSAVSQCYILHVLFVVVAVVSAAVCCMLQFVHAGNVTCVYLPDFSKKKEIPSLFQPVFSKPTHNILVLRPAIKIRNRLIIKSL